MRADQAIKSATASEWRLREAMTVIAKLATDCRRDLQGRLQDDEHSRAFAVLGSIEDRARAALKG